MAFIYFGKIQEITVLEKGRSITNGLFQVVQNKGYLKFAVIVTSPLYPLTVVVVDEALPKTVLLTTVPEPDAVQPLKLAPEGTLAVMVIGLLE